MSTFQVLQLRFAKPALCALPGLVKIISLRKQGMPVIFPDSFTSLLPPSGFMSIASLLLPDFTLIVLGFVLFRVTNWGQAFWSGAEKLVYSRPCCFIPPRARRWTFPAPASSCRRRWPP